MKQWLLSAAAVLCGMLAGMTPAPAGYWNYGCKGSVGDTAVMFGRNTFLIMPTRLARGEVAGLVDSQI